jgi:thiamine-monophosphate kinase
MSLGEFDIIHTYFNKKIKRQDVVLGLGDDCAILEPPAGKEIIVSTDSLVLNRHFLPETSPFDVGYRAVAVSLSDIAAMGGNPAWLMLSLVLPKVDESWLDEFSKGLFFILEKFNVDLIGGNISRGPLSITTQAIGYGISKNLLRRSAAVPGDLIYVTYTLGDAALALALIKKEIQPDLFSAEEIAELTRALWQPTPRIVEGQAIGKLAHAAIDISDGLLADLSHIMANSQVGAMLYLENIPLSASLKKLPNEKKIELALSGGDDYELCFTVSPKQLPQLDVVNEHLNYPFTCIGQITTHPGLRIKDLEGKSISFSQKGYQHFSEVINKVCG